MLIIYAPMIALLLFILVYTSEMTLQETAEITQSPIVTPGRHLQKTIHETRVQARKHVATIYPTFVRTYSRYRNSVNKVRLKEIMRNTVLMLKPILMELDIELVYEE